MRSSPRHRRKTMRRKMMMRTEPPPGLIAALAQVGLSWAELTRQASDVLLFGSRASGWSHEGSDWDVLCVGHGPTRPRSRVDIVWVGPRTSRSLHWLGSELASHVLAFGRPLQGDCAWARDVRLSPRAVQGKRRRVMARISSLERLWPCVRLGFKERHGRLLRREIQRACLMDQGAPVPPAGQLDAMWSDDHRSVDGWRALTSWMEPTASARARVLCKPTWPAEQLV